MMVMKDILINNYTYWIMDTENIQKLKKGYHYIMFNTGFGISFGTYLGCVEGGNVFKASSFIRDQNQLDGVISPEALARVTLLEIPKDVVKDLDTNSSYNKVIDFIYSVLPED